VREFVRKTTTSIRCFAALAILGGLPAWSDATIPASDRPGSKDHPMLRRYEGSLIVGYERQGFAEFTLPLSRLERVTGKTDSHNNVAFEPKQKKPLEGAYTRLVYLIPGGRSPLEVLRNYQQDLQSKGGRILFECKAEECGGEASRGSSGGGGWMSLAMYLYPEERIKDPDFSNGNCAVSSLITDQRYLSAEVPSSAAHVSVLTYSVKNDLYCKAFNGRTIAVVDIIESKAREQKMVVVRAQDMAQQISTVGSVSLYGIYFDVNKAEVKPESSPTLKEIAELLRSSPGLKLLVVGHTDGQGSFAANLELSQRRATSVVGALVSRFRVNRNRLSPVGVSSASPVASNKTEAGRALNRRVQLVEN
jgi:outer membrane protein OmpA-like peptidoglycan-associated protein